MKKTFFVVSWISESLGSGTYAGVCGKLFSKREKAEQFLKECLDAEKIDMLTAYEEDEIEVDYECGIVHDNADNYQIRYEINEVEEDE